MSETAAINEYDFLAMAAQVTAAWLGNPNPQASAADAPALLRSIRATLAAPAAAQVEPAPAVPVRASVTPDYLVSLIDRTKLKSLKRHFARHGLTPDDYRARYGLKPNDPMVAANYFGRRRESRAPVGRQICRHRGLRRPAVRAGRCRDLMAWWQIATLEP